MNTWHLLRIVLALPVSIGGFVLGYRFGKRRHCSAPVGTPTIDGIIAGVFFAGSSLWLLILLGNFVVWLAGD
jgi:CDP-diglyceride synthetase